VVDNVIQVTMLKGELVEFGAQHFGFFFQHARWSFFGEELDVNLTGYHFN
jgi:hypothetical protein